MEASSWRLHLVEESSLCTAEIYLHLRSVTGTPSRVPQMGRSSSRAGMNLFTFRLTAHQLFQPTRPPVSYPLNFFRSPCRRTEGNFSLPTTAMASGESIVHRILV